MILAKICFLTKKYISITLNYNYFISNGVDTGNYNLIALSFAVAIKDVAGGAENNFNSKFNPLAIVAIDGSSITSL